MCIRDRHDTRELNPLADQYFIVPDVLLGTHHQTDMIEYRTDGSFGNGQTGTLRLFKDLEMVGGNLTIFDSVKGLPLLSFANDDYHADHPGNIKFEAGIVGRGSITVYPITCPENITTNCEMAFGVDTGANVTAGRTLTILGNSVEAPTAEAKFSINRLGVNGANSFNINHNQSIDSFGIENFYGKNGGILSLIHISEPTRPY